MYYDNYVVIQELFLLLTDFHLVHIDENFYDDTNVNFNIAFSVSRLLFFASTRALLSTCPVHTRTT